MGRIRTIKPEFPQSESVGRLSRDARLLFILLWTVADDEGRARAASRMLASLLYPYDDDAPGLVGGWLDELEARGVIRRYEVEGDAYLEITNWLKHQKIDRPSASRFPPFVEGSRVVAEPSATDLGPRTKDQDQGPGTDSRARGRATVDEVAKLFDEFWVEYPRRAGGNPRIPAVKSFAKAIATGRKNEINREVAAAIIGAARRYAAECRNLGKIETEKVAQAVTWLNQMRWGDYPEKAPDAPALPSGKFHAAAESAELAAWDRWSRATRGKPMPRDKTGGWICESRWPPDHAAAIDPPVPVHTVDNSTRAAELFGSRESGPV